MENTNYYEHSKKEATKKKFEEKNEKKDCSKWHLSFKRWKQDQRSDHSGKGR